MQPEGVKSAYRRKAKETHPDFFASASPHVQQIQTSLFRDVLDAYYVINLFFKQREEGLWHSHSRSRTTSNPQKTPRQTKKTKKTADDNWESENFSRRPLPFRTLEIGRYLYYQGHISYQQLINALVWQRKQRPIIGDIALRWKWLTPAAIERINRTDGRPCRFGTRAVELGLLSSFQVKTLLFYQRSQQQRLGKYFVRMNILTTEEMDAFVQELRQHNASVLGSMVSASQGQSAYA